MASRTPGRKPGMRHHDGSLVSAGEVDMPQDPAATTQTMPRSRSSTGTPGRLLAQLPDLSVEELETLVEEHIAASDGRMISQSLASKFVVGGGILLVVAALLPFTMARKTQPKPVGNDLARWHSTPAPEADVAPGWNGGGGQTAGENSPAGGPTGSAGVDCGRSDSRRPGRQRPCTDLGGGCPGVAGRRITGGGKQRRGLESTEKCRRRACLRDSRPAAIDCAGRGGESADGPDQLGSGDRRPVYQADARNDPANAYRGENRNSPPPAVSPVVPDPNREVPPPDPGAPPPPPTSDLPPTQPSAAPPPPPSDMAQLDPIVPLPSTQDHQ